MSDRYAASYYEQLHPAQAQAQAAMSHYAPPGYRNAPYAPVGSYNSSPYGYGYAAGGSASYMPNYYRYAPYASPHYSQPPHSHSHPLHQQPHQQPSHHHPGMFTPAGQQLIPSSVLHYPPRSHPQPQQQQHPHHLQQSLPHHAYQQPASNSSYEQPPPALYSASSYGQSRGFTAYQSSSTHYAPPGRSTTPAPNRTVLPPNYLEPMRNSFTDQQQQQQLPKVEETLPELKLEHEAEAASPTQRLTTSPPLISATGTDSGISNCSTRARSDSSQSTPVYSGEYPVNMSVESASCVSYHCPADGRDYDEEQQQQQQQQQQHQQQQQQQQHQPQQQQETEEPKPGSVSSSSDDISATAATSTSPTSSVNDIDKAAATAEAAAAAATTNEAEATTATDEAQSEVVRRAEINLAKPNKEATPTTATKLPPQDIVEQQQQQQQQPATNQINEDAAEHGQQQQQQASSTATSHNWSPTPRRPRTPPAPQNSPVGFGLSASSAPPTVPPALAPLLQLQQQQQQHHLHQPQQQHLSGNSKRHAKNRHSSNCNNNSNNSGNNRIIECDLIPSKKSKRKSSKKEADADHVDATESTVREQIRDIKPLPGFLQAFGSTEIGRFSERFLQTPESLVERLVEEYAHSNGGYATSNGYYDAPMNGAAATGVGGMHGYWPYEEQHNMAYQQSQQFARNRMRGQGYPYPDYAAYERYGYAAYSANRSRYGEIRCNGY
ncbi:myb-like protein AA [Drosophila nasuta]|uniref:myb-like protein AA n=1 Tax=Drosophila nasuta TaxID=42062 RepID=UPI00295E8AA4|nr:myb-like protein AA [Drosophila nasuta]